MPKCRHFPVSDFSIRSQTKPQSPQAQNLITLIRRTAYVLIKYVVVGRRLLSAHNPQTVTDLVVVVGLVVWWVLHQPLSTVGRIASRGQTPFICIHSSLG